MYGYIYKTTNLVNGKIYIGQHKAEKFEPEIYLGSGTLFRRALYKYGKDNFTQQLLCECMSQQEMNAKEKHYIQKYNATDIKVGYNLSVGGIGGSHSAWNKGLTKETDERVAKYTSSRKNSFKGNFGMSNGNAKNLKPIYMRYCLTLRNIGKFIMLRRYINIFILVDQHI